MQPNEILGILVWAFIAFLLYRLIRRMVKNGGSVATASAEAHAEGGEALSGAHADVGGIHLHIHIGDGISLSRTDADGSFAIDPAELLRSGTIDGGGIRSLPNGDGNIVHEGGNSAGALPAGIHQRRRTRNHGLAIGE